MLPMAVARSSGGVTQFQGKGQFGGFLPIWDPYKTAEPIEMPFGLMTVVGPRPYVLDWDPISQGKGPFWGKRSGPL